MQSCVKKNRAPRALRWRAEFMRFYCSPRGPRSRKLVAIAVVIDVTSGLGRFGAKCHRVWLLSLLGFGGRFSRLLVLEILLRNRSAAAHTIDHLVFLLAHNISAA